MPFLSNADAALLQKIKDTGPINANELTSEESQRTGNLIDRKLISIEYGNLIQSDGINSRDFYIAPLIDFEHLLKITPAGTDALQEFKEERRKQAQDEKQQRFENQVSVANLLIPLVTFILGLLVEHFSGVINLLLKLLG